MPLTNLYKYIGENYLSRCWENVVNNHKYLSAAINSETMLQMKTYKKKLERSEKV